MRTGYTLAMIVTLSLAVALVGAQKPGGKKPDKGKPAASSLVARGKTVCTQNKCNTCHGPTLAGKPGGAPNLHMSGELKQYNPTTFARALNKGLTEDGQKIKAPMPIYHLATKDTDALFAYLKSLK